MDSHDVRGPEGDRPTERLVVSVVLATDTERANPEGDRPTQRLVVSFLKALPLTAIVTALLYYFGVVRTQHLYAYFGADISMFNYSVADYLIRSLALYPTPVVICAAVFGAAWMFQGIVSWSNNHKRAKLLSFLLFVAGLAAILLAELFRSLGSTYWAPTLWISGTLLLLCTIYVIHTDNPQLPQWLVVLSSGLGLVVLLLSGFYLLSDHAICSAKADAADQFDHLAEWPSVTIARRLLTDVSTPTSTMVYSDTTFEYPSLKLLTVSNGKYFLVPPTATMTSSTTYIFDPDSAALVKLTRGEIRECRWPYVEFP